MRKEKAAGYIGLALFSLFPLLGAFQVRDPAEGWRAIATRTRSSILSVQPRTVSGTPAASPSGCAVVLSMNPTRVVVAGAVTQPSLCTVQNGDRVEWRPIYIDPSHDFTILEGEGNLRVSASRARAQLAAGVVPIDPATVGDLESEGVPSEAVDAILVAPEWLDPSPLWVGALRLQRLPDGRLSYSGNRLRVLPDAAGRASVGSDSETQTPPPTRVDPVLRGAPFVTLEGVVLGLYAGEHEGRTRAVPMALVREALSGIDRRAAH